MINRRQFIASSFALAACKPTEPAERPQMTTNIIVRAGGGSPDKGVQIGEIQTLRLRSPNAPITGKVIRMRLKRTLLKTVFTNDVVSRASQRWPMSIEIIDTVDPGGVITTVVENAWIKDIGYAFASSEYIIVDHFTFEAEEIYAVQ